MVINHMRYTVQPLKPHYRNAVLIPPNQYAATVNWLLNNASDSGYLMSELDNTVVFYSCEIEAWWRLAVLHF